MMLGNLIGGMGGYDMSKWEKRQTYAVRTKIDVKDRDERINRT